MTKHSLLYLQPMVEVHTSSSSVTSLSSQNYLIALLFMGFPKFEPSGSISFQDIRPLEFHNYFSSCFTLNLFPGWSQGVNLDSYVESYEYDLQYAHIFCSQTETFTTTKNKMLEMWGLLCLPSIVIGSPNQSQCSTYQPWFSWSPLNWG